MKNMILLASIFLTAFEVSAQTTTPNIQCKVKANQYADNTHPYKNLPPFPIVVTNQTASSMTGKIEGGTFPVDQNFQIKIGGYIEKPDFAWGSDRSMLLLTMELLRFNVTTKKTEIIVSKINMSGTIRSQRELDQLKSGRVWIEESLPNPDYLALQRQGAPVPNEMLVDFAIVCELAR